MATIEIRQLSVDYFIQRTQQRFVALQALTFDIHQGEFVAIVGPSGCGKSTLLQAIAGLQPIANGHVLQNGAPVRAPSGDRGMVFQSPALLPWRTVLDNTAYGLELQGYQRRVARQQAQQFVDLVGLQGFEASYPRELSGGMQQRVNLARALAIKPTLLLCDEPLSALDAQTRELMQAELQRIWLHSRPTTLYVTHQINEAIFLADRIVVMTPRPGRIKAIISVDLPRPRTLSMQRSAPFVTLEEQIWQLLHSEPMHDRMFQ